MIDPELRWTWLPIWLDSAGSTMPTSLPNWNGMPRSPERSRRRALALHNPRPRPRQTPGSWLWRTTRLPNGTQSAICLGFLAAGQDGLLAPCIPRYFEAAEAISSATGIWATRGISLRNNVLRFLFPWPVEKEPVLLELDAWLQRTELTASVRRWTRRR